MKNKKNLQQGFTPIVDFGNATKSRAKSALPKFTTGFTLIEIIVYVALFGIMIGGIITSVYDLSQSSDNTDTKVTAGEEINFLIRKLDWLLVGAKGSSVVVSDSGKEISFKNPSLSANTIVLRLNVTTNDIEIEKDGKISALTTKNVKVENLQFSYSSKKIVSTSIKINGIEINTSTLLTI